MAKKTQKRTPAKFSEAVAATAGKRLRPQNLSSIAPGEYRGPRIKHRCPRRPRGGMGGGGANLTPEQIREMSINVRPKEWFNSTNPYAGGGGGIIAAQQAGAGMIGGGIGGGGRRPSTFNTPYGTAYGRSGFAMKRGSKPNFKDLGSKNK